MFLVFITLILALIPIYVLYVHFKWQAEDKKIGVPGPPCLPLIGNMFLLWKYIRNDTIHEILLDVMEEYGETIRLRFGPRLVISTRDVKVIEQVVNNPKFGKSQDYKSFEPWLGTGLLFSTGEKWHKMRKLLTPAFHFQILERFIPVFEEQSQVFLGKLNKLSEREVIDVVPWFHAFALDVITETSMGYKANAQTNSESRFVKANKELLDLIIMRYFIPIYRIEFVWRLTKYYRIVQEQIKYFHSFVDTIISQRRDALLSRPESADDNQRPALLDILLRGTVDGKPLSNQDIRDEVNGFMLAGHETTGTTLGFLSFILAKYPEVQSRVYDEIKSTGLDATDNPLTIRDINSLSYFENVIKETLRLFPILGSAHKCSPEDIRIGNIVIPAYASITTSIRGSHVYEKNFKDPLKFDPSRWDCEVTKEERNPYAYQPFSSGLRNCIGQRFALLEMKTLMIHILRKFEIQLGHESFEVALKHKSLHYSGNGVQVKFKKRST